MKRKNNKKGKPKIKKNQKYISIIATPIIGYEIIL
jgi:hypothetical protein